MRICLFANPQSVHTRRIVEGLVRRGVSMHVVYNGEGCIPHATYEPFAIPAFGPLNPMRRNARRRRYLRRFFREFDVVGVHFLHHWGITPETADDGCLTVTPWGSDICPPPGGPQPSDATLDRRRALLRCAHRVTALCDSFAADIARFADLDETCIERVPLGVDLELFKPPATRPRQPVVGFNKGFGHAYGADVLIQAMPQVIDAVGGVAFELAGDGPLRQECLTLALSLGVSDRIRWIDRVPCHTQVPRMMSRWTIAAVPSFTESFGVAALEAAAMQIPVVASRVGGLRETVAHGQTGLLVPAGDPERLALAIIDLLRDRDRCVAMGEAGRQFVAERFEWNDCVTRWLDFYERAAGVVSCRN